MKILIDIRCLMFKQYSGVANYAFNLLSALFKIDQENEYILFYNSAKKIDLPKWNQPNVKYAGFSYPNKLFNLTLNFFNWPKIDKLAGGADIFFAPNLHFVSWSKDCRKIIAVHDLSFLRFPEFFTWKQRFWHWLILRRNIISQADLILADSESTKNDLIELLRVKAEKIQVVYLGVSDEFKILPAENLAAVKTKYCLPAKFILYLGALEPRKNIESVIGAFNLLPDLEYNLIIAGAVGWKTKNIFRLAEGRQKIKFIGYVDEADKPALYNLASFFVYPSYYEGFGLPILEAMACGCPVIAGSNSSQVETAGGAALLVNPYDVNEILEAMRAMATEDSLRLAFRKQGLARAKEFSWRKTAGEVVNNFKI